MYHSLTVTFYNVNEGHQEYLSSELLESSRQLWATRDGSEENFLSPPGPSRRQNNKFGFDKDASWEW